ncbi:hypothetical protein F0P96_03505 [Hymenobacter busanensis]|uniref:Uncharacterized protein n=1 Tax=Hymenobacter busanensis TaxID=2607656 RepID=A0A7L4ZTV4_9BACT|nr:hypothetical protein [Hymenobacter busanensis]KAA9339694.1 hypothetical protein F0P96_03505 [Hymenobacter busanensis]QHJ06551.1 hypothetical protein GUY19_04245 [Hymenobacter busanensis]
MRFPFPFVRRVAQLSFGAVALLGTACQSRHAREAAELKLLQIDGLLLNSNNALIHSNEVLLRGLQAKAEKNRNTPADLALLKQGKAVHDTSHALVERLREVREMLLRQTDNQAGIKHLGGEKEVAALMQSEAPRLQKVLARHAGFLQRAASAKNTTSVAPTTKTTKGAIDFTDVSLAAALTALSQQEAEALLLETRTLTELQTRIGAAELTTTLRPLVTAEANTVAPGETYRAQLVLAHALNSPGALTMTANGQPLTVGADGIAHVRFVVPSLGGAARKQASWLGVIRGRWNGLDTTFQIRVPYTIVRK